MPMEREARVWADAQDPKAGLTFGELRRFVTEGMRADVPDGTVVKIDMTWRGTAKRVHVQGIEVADLPADSACARCGTAWLLPETDDWITTASTRADCEHTTKGGRR